MRLSLAIVCLFILCPSAAFALPYNTSEFDAGVQISHITYKEPDLMRESGIMYGVHAFYAKSFQGLRWKIDGTLSRGEVDYVGSLSDGTPLTVENIQDTMFEARVAVGPTSFVYSDSYYLPYIGFGYRYLYDGADVGPGGYRRESNYLYIPIGIEGVPFVREKWSAGFTLEYDLFLRGRQLSYLSDADPGFSDMENEQTSGRGYRASLKFIRSGKHDLVIEPFYKYWSIDESDTQIITYMGIPYAYGYEPKNNSTEIGIKMLIRF